MSNLQIKISVSKIYLRKIKSLTNTNKKMSFIRKNCLMSLFLYAACLFSAIYRCRYFAFYMSNKSTF